MKFVIESTDTDDNGDEWIHGYLYKDGVLTDYAGINADWYYSQMMNARNSLAIPFFLFFYFFLIFIFHKGETRYGKRSKTRRYCSIEAF